MRLAFLGVPGIGLPATVAAWWALRLVVVSGGSVLSWESVEAVDPVACLSA